LVRVSVFPVEVAVRLGALDAEPPEVEPKENSLVPESDTTLANPPVPVQVKPVALAMLTNTPVPLTCIFVDPKAMARVLELLELNLLQITVNPLRARVPWVSVRLMNVLPTVEPRVRSLPSVTVIPAPETTSPPVLEPPIVFPADVNVPVPLIVNVP
jgi:hypothetical protein